MQGDPMGASSAGGDVSYGHCRSVNRDDTYTAHQRLEHTSRVETRLANDALRDDGLDPDNHWLKATRDGDVAIVEGEPNAAAFAKPGATDLDALRQMRISHLKQRATQRQAWLGRGHGVYASVADERGLFRQLAEHARLVCHVYSGESFESRLLHQHFRALCSVHLETFFCSLDAEKAPMIMSMVELGSLPSVLLCRDGKVEGPMHGVDSTFTAESFAFELSQRGLVDFEDGVSYRLPDAPVGAPRSALDVVCSDESDLGDD